MGKTAIAVNLAHCAVSAGYRTLLWDLDEQGVPLKKAGAFPLGNDGIGVDCAGNIYDHGGAIHNPQGQQIGTFPGGTNMAFGGPDGHTLLVVGMGRGARTVQMNLPGLP